MTKAVEESTDRGILSGFDRRKRSVRASMTGIHVFLFIGLVIAGLGPILWLAKAAVTPTQDTISTPMALFPNGIDWDNLVKAWTEVHVDQYFFNTIVLAVLSFVYFKVTERWSSN